MVRCFIKEILSGVGCLLMDSGNATVDLLPASGTLFLVLELTLQRFKPAFGLLQELMTFNEFPLAGCQELFQSEVNPDRISVSWNIRNRDIASTTDTDVVSTCFFDDSDLLRNKPLGYRTGVPSYRSPQRTRLISNG